jgi:hypothetical protein
MSTTPDVPVPDDTEQAEASPPPSKKAVGVEIGMSEDANTFEPEEDPDAKP